MVQKFYSSKCAFETLEDIKDKQITVMGLGLNGGGEACVKFFLKHGAYVTVTDMKTEEQLEPTIKSISQCPYYDEKRLRYVLGKHDTADFEFADCVIKNPGVKYEGNKYLQAAKAIETDISIFLHFTKAPIIAVTGSKGKSSTVSAIQYGLSAIGFKSFLGGNITVSPLTFLEETNENTPVVLELSSWQLSDLRGRKVLKPLISIITKIVPDHLNWYGEMDAYVEDKKLIYADQTRDDFTILDFDPDDYLMETKTPVEGISCWGDLFASETNGTVLRYSKNPMPENTFGAWLETDEDGNSKGYITLKGRCEKELIMKELKVPGEHMKTNVLNASLVLYLMGIEPEHIRNVMSSWNGIPHRLEPCHEWTSPADNRKITFYNDSCATVPEATAAASQSFKKRIVLICGGTDKGLGFEILADTLEGKNNAKYLPYKTFLLEGNGTEKLTKLLDEKNVKYEGPYESLESLLNAVKDSLVSKDAAEIYGDSQNAGPLPVVFSPGATSFGMFTNEFDRGNKFKALCQRIFVIPN